MTNRAPESVPAHIIGCFDADPTACFVVLDADASRTMLHAFVPLRLRAAIRLGHPVLMRLLAGDPSHLTVAAIVDEAAADASVQPVRFNGQTLRLLLERPLRLCYGKSELVIHPGGHMEAPSLGVCASPDGTLRVAGHGPNTLH